MTTRQSESNHVMGIVINSPAKLQNALNSLSSPQAAQALLETLNFIRECMKMNKIYPNFLFFFFDKNRNKNDSPCVFVLLFTVSLLLKPFRSRLSTFKI